MRGALRVNVFSWGLVSTIRTRVFGVAGLVGEDCGRAWWRLLFAGGCCFGFGLGAAGAAGGGGTGRPCRGGGDVSRC